MINASHTSTDCTYFLVRDKKLLPMAYVFPQVRAERHDSDDSDESVLEQLTDG